MGIDLPIHLEYLSPLAALGLFGLLGLPIVYLGMRSLNGLGVIRKWVAIGARLLLLLCLVLLLGGVRWMREHKTVEVMVVRDLSDSTSYVQRYPQATLRESVNSYLQDTLADKRKEPDDRLGVVGFANRAVIETLPKPILDLGARSVMEGGTGTDVASAIHLALASMKPDAMHRMLLVWDGNQTTGDLNTAIEAAAAQHVPIDVMPLHYAVENAVMMERFIAPTWRRENEPFNLDIILRNAGSKSVTGTLAILHQGKPIDLDADTEGFQPSKRVTLSPGLTAIRVKVPPLEGGIHNFRSVFEIDNNPALPVAQKPTLVTGAMDAFTIVQGQGAILYVDNVGKRGGGILPAAVAPEGLNLKTISVDELPRELFAFQNYDAVVLANVPNGAGGVDQQQDAALATYVHDMGGGLVMIGGPESFGAGGWQGSQVEKILPVNMDIPARKEIGKGALVMIVHACEMPDGNYWGEQCALKAVDALSALDEIGVISFNWGGNGSSGSQWDFPLQPKGEGNKAKAAIKQMKVGDMPSFEDSMKVALYGSGGNKGLKDSDAQHKHVIIISDGDPQKPADDLLADYRKAKVSVSTVAVYPHDLSAAGLPPTMRLIAEELKGRAYGPINSKPDQLPQIFIKEATIVRRTLIHEDAAGIPLRLMPTLSDVVQGLGSSLPPVTGLVLTSRKPDPMIDVPIVAGKYSDPLLAHWQSGLGKAAVYTSDAHTKWGSQWVASPAFGKFWAQVIRSVSRAPMSRNMDIQTRVEGDTIHVVAEAMDKDNHRISFLDVTGQIIGPDMKAKDIRLNQTGPGRYEAVIEKAQPGAYVTRLQYSGPKGESGWQVAGIAMNSNPEMRDLRSNDAMLEQVAQRTGGMMLTPFDAPSANLFRREGLQKSSSPMPIWNIMLPIAMGLLLLDVAIRRIAWNFPAVIAAIGRYSNTFRSHRVEQSASVDALRRLRETPKDTPPPAKPAVADGGQPDPGRKFESRGIGGNINDVVGGAVEQRPAKASPQAEEKGQTPAATEPGDHTSSLLAAKRRARQQIDKKEET